MRDVRPSYYLGQTTIAPPAAASAGSGAAQDPVLAPLQMEAAVKKVQADIAGYDKAIRDSQTDTQPPRQGGGK